MEEMLLGNLAFFFKNLEKEEKVNVALSKKNEKLKAI